ncbi:histidinol-phosphatase [Amycolatopsis cihanbeyliensis]|uniref:Histidinol-phosphatase n=1 Tax=Amycolatopsis cihanbeyliensis TaxID=1128664 RepID=A0A542DNU8_AMYCI|nr:histidinol-phosphatase [Amycolatopsis cihanbeyliensis]TQJ04768.1 histidinol-phosphatase [Amycolatopsis cihanbeyliensis]
MSRYTEDLTLGRELADAADEITVARFRARDLTVRSKPDRTPVTDADTAVEDAIRARLGTARPADAVAGEERGGAAGDTGRTWVLDPIDGTKNFLRGLPVWATLIALVEDGAPVVGVVSAPLLGRRWWAAAGAGSWLADAAGQHRLAVSGVSALSDAYLSTTHLGSWVEHHSRESYLALADACWENRAFGDFWSHCLVAEGAVDIAAEAVVNPWDVAAVRVLVTEAGGRFSDLGGNPGIGGGSALSTNGPLHEPALELLSSFT